MSMYGAYGSAPINSSKYLTIGSTYHIVANIQKYNGKFQISGIEFSIGKRMMLIHIFYQSTIIFYLIHKTLSLMINQKQVYMEI